MFAAELYSLNKANSGFSYTSQIRGNRIKSSAHAVRMRRLRFPRDNPLTSKAAETGRQTDSRRGDGEGTYTNVRNRGKPPPKAAQSTADFRNSPREATGVYNPVHDLADR